MDFKAQLDLHIRARSPIIVVVTQEEERVFDIVTSISLARKKAAYSWDVAAGMQRLTQENTPLLAAPKENDVLPCILKGTENSIWLLPDFQRFWEDPVVERQIVQTLKTLPFSKKNIIISQRELQIPQHLKPHFVVLEAPLPDQSELKEVLDRLLRSADKELSLEPALETKLLRAAVGLTAAQAQRAFAQGIVKDGTLCEEDVIAVIEEKRAAFQDSSAIEFYNSQESLSNVGGLTRLKEWLRLREKSFSSAAKEYGLPTPKGIALIGIPGTGKSLSAKMIAGLWGLPLLRLDVGAVFGSYIGQSEAQIRQALRVAERVSPCILWIDEMEKALAYGGNDSGTSTRVFGTLLTWMSDKEAPVFVAATANDVSSLPPELLRRGRFDEIFFLDLPNEQEREAIFKVHIRKKGRDPAQYNFPPLIAASEGFVGAEIEQAIVDAMFLGFDSAREFTTEDILECLEQTIPLARSQFEKISYLRSWVTQGRAISASITEKEALQCSKENQS